jgi:hypothetical protein
LAAAFAVIALATAAPAPASYLVARNATIVSLKVDHERQINEIGDGLAAGDLSRTPCSQH